MTNKTIWKYSLSMSKQDPIVMPEGAKILTAQMQGGEICLWAMVDPEAKKMERSFVIIGTGHGFVDEGLFYVGTVQEGSFVWHVFEKKWW